MNTREMRCGHAVVTGFGLSLGLGLALSLALALIPTASAQAAEPVAVRNKSAAGRVKSAWTPERLRAARPLQTPRLSVAYTALGSIAEEAVSGRSVSAPGQRPLPGIRPLKSNRLFDPAPRGTAGAYVRGIAEPAGGSTGALFTSHYLIPEDADLEYPYSTAGKFFFTIPGEGDFYCSGAVLRKRIVITAGGCVHQGSGGNNGFYEDFLFVPAYRDGDAPLGVWEWAAVTVSAPWSQSNGRLPNAADWALVEMADQTFDGEELRIGDVTGTVGYATRRLRPNHATILAYPSNFDQGEWMHQVSAKDFRATKPPATNNVEYGSDMRAGSEGGPLFQDFGDDPNLVKLVGVLSYYTSSAKVKTQGASVLDNRFATDLDAVCAEQAGNC
jgi:V8-like Glu-specific endopeptidase